MAKKGDLVVYERSDRPIYVFGSKVKPVDEKSRKSYDVEMVKRLVRGNHNIN
jgi:hypothetical protein